MGLLKNLKKQKGFENVEFNTENEAERHLVTLGVHPRVIEILKLPQHEQRSLEWFAQRKEKLTASDIDAVCGNNKYSSRDDVLFKKHGVSPPFTGNAATLHGQKYEDEAIGHYCRLMNKNVFDFGLLPHPNIPFLAGSPDGITWDGIVLEVKCPLRRKIVKGEIPKHYMGQILINMEISNLDRGVFIEYIPKDLSKTGEIELNIVPLNRNPKWFEEIYPKVSSFWEEYGLYKEKGIEAHPEYKKYFLKANPVCLAQPENFDPEKNIVGN